MPDPLAINSLHDPLTRQPDRCQRKHPPRQRQSRRQALLQRPRHQHRHLRAPRRERERRLRLGHRLIRVGAHFHPPGHLVAHGVPSHHLLQVPMGFHHLRAIQAIQAIHTLMASHQWGLHQGLPSAASLPMECRMQARMACTHHQGQPW